VEHGHGYFSIVVQSRGSHTPSVVSTNCFSVAVRNAKHPFRQTQCCAYGVWWLSMKDYPVVYKLPTVHCHTCEAIAAPKLKPGANRHIGKAICASCGTVIKSIPLGLIRVQDELTPVAIPAVSASN
jgi:hypothetical protein